MEAGRGLPPALALGASPAALVSCVPNTENGKKRAGFLPWKPRKGERTKETKLKYSRDLLQLCRA